MVLAEKHGTCSFPVFRDEYSYFLTTLNLYFKYNVTVSFKLGYALNSLGFTYSNSSSKAVQKTAVFCFLLFQLNYILTLLLQFLSILPFGLCIWPISFFVAKNECQRVLNEAGYLPSNTEKYPLGGIVSAIQNAFHATPKLDCSKDAVNELHLCFYKDFKVRICLLCQSITIIYMRPWPLNFKFDWSKLECSTCGSLGCKERKHELMLGLTCFPIYYLIQSINLFYS